MNAFKTLDDLPDDLSGKRVLVRVDLNVPMNGASVADDTRLRALLPTVLELSDRGAIVLIDDVAAKTSNRADDLLPCLRVAARRAGRRLGRQRPHVGSAELAVHQVPEVAVPHPPTIARGVAVGAGCHDGRRERDG